MSNPATNVIVLTTAFTIIRLIRRFTNKQKAEK